MQKIDCKMKRGIALPGIVNSRLGFVKPTLVAFGAFLLWLEVRMLDRNALGSRIALASATAMATARFAGFFPGPLIVRDLVRLGFDSEHAS